MSNLWSYRPEKCDGDYCPMDCDKCSKGGDEDDDRDQSA